MTLSAEEKRKRINQRNLERYYNGVRYEQLERVRTLVDVVRSFESCAKAVEYVQNTYRVREFKKGE